MPTGTVVVGKTRVICCFGGCKNKDVGSSTTGVQPRQWRMPYTRRVVLAAGTTNVRRLHPDERRAHDIMIDHIDGGSGADWCIAYLTEPSNYRK